MKRDHRPTGHPCNPESFGRGPTVAHRWTGASVIHVGHSRSSLSFRPRNHWSFSVPGSVCSLVCFAAFLAHPLASGSRRPPRHRRLPSSVIWSQALVVSGTPSPQASGSVASYLLFKSDNSDLKVTPEERSHDR